MNELLLKKYFLFSLFSILQVACMWVNPIYQPRSSKLAVENGLRVTG